MTNLPGNPDRANRRSQHRRRRDDGDAVHQRDGVHRTTIDAFAGQTNGNIEDLAAGADGPAEEGSYQDQSR
ncbi:MULTISPECIES: hypothetical protein [Micromonospora]|uniref:hypothetical protein n=1 Tax=Micromonospora TaxID=1873 RepID=UPI000F86912D|nr:MULTISPECIES: hypothetical protein [Micromonospora]